MRWLVPGSGAAFGYCEAVDDVTRDCLIGEIAEKGTVNEWYAKINRCMEVGHYWQFVRFAGASALLNVSYGFLAAAVARLTGGFLNTSDGAWEYVKFPAQPDAFLQWYFQPGQTREACFRDWALQCLAGLPEELVRW